MISKETLEKLAKSQKDLGGVSQEKLLEAMATQNEELVPDDPISQLVYYIGIMDDEEEAIGYLSYALCELKSAYYTLTKLK